MFGFLKKVINPLSIVKPVAAKGDEATIVDEKDASSATSDDVKQVINADEKSKHPETVEDEVKNLHVLEEEPDKDTAIEIGSDDVSKDNSDSVELEPDSFLEELTEDGPNIPSIAATQKNITDTDTTTDTVNANEVSAVESGMFFTSVTVCGTFCSVAVMSALFSIIEIPSFVSSTNTDPISSWVVSI